MDGIEVDVHTSADGVPVLIHDPTLDRTTDASGRVSEYDLVDLRRIDAGVHGFGGNFRGECIPSLAEAAELTRGRCLLVVEIKQPGIAQAVVDVLRRAGIVREAMVWSFDLQTTSEAHRLDPHLPAFLLSSKIDSPQELFDAALANNLSGVSIAYACLDASIVLAARARGLSVYAWTADDPDEQSRLADCGVDGIVTNVPATLLRTLAAGTI